MPIDRMDSNQVINRQRTLTFVERGIVLDLLSCGEIANATSTTALPTGQVRQTGKTAAVDVACTISLANRIAVAQVESLRRGGRSGAKGYVGAGLITDFAEDGTPGPFYTVEEMQITSVTYPSTSVGDDGGASELSFNVSMLNVQVMPGT